MQSNSNFTKSFLLFLTLFFLLIFSINVFSESARLYTSTGAVVEPGWSGFFFQHHTTPNGNNTQRYMINFLEGWSYDNFREHVLEEVLTFNDNNFFKCDPTSGNNTVFNVDVLSGETIVASYKQFSVLSGTNYPDNFYCRKENSSLPDTASGSNWPSLTFKKFVDDGNNSYAQPNNLSNDFDCDQNKFWIQFVKPNGDSTQKFMCEDDPTIIDTCVKSFVADINGVWKVRFGNGIVYEAIHCSFDTDPLSPDYNSFQLERKWGINSWDINVVKPSATSPSLGRVWLPNWNAAGFSGKDINFFVLASAIGNDPICNDLNVIFGQGIWSNCFSEYFQLRLKNFRLNWAGIATNDKGLYLDGLNGGRYVQGSVPIAAYVNPKVLVTLTKTLKQVFIDSGYPDYTGCGEEYYWFNTNTTDGYNTGIGPWVKGYSSQRIYVNEPEFSKKPGNYVPFVEVKEKIDSYVFNLSVGENVSKYYQIFIDLDKDGDYFDINDWYSSPQEIHNTGQYVWDLKDRLGKKFSVGDYNYLVRFYSTVTNVPVVGSASAANLELSRPIGGKLVPDLLFWDDTKAGGELNIVGQNKRVWDSDNKSGPSCSGGSLSRSNCYCLDRTPNNERITHLYELNQSVGFHDAMNTWAYGDVNMFYGNIRVIEINNNIVSLDVVVLDENNIEINLSCTYDTVLNSTELPITLNDGFGNPVGLTFTSDLNCNASGSTITATTNTPLERDSIYSVSTSLEGVCNTCERETFFTFDDKERGKVSIPDNNLILVFLLFISVLFFVSKKRK